MNGDNYHIDIQRLHCHVRGLSPQVIQNALTGLGETLLRQLAEQQFGQKNSSAPRPVPGMGRRRLERLELHLDRSAASSPVALQQALVTALAQAIGEAIQAGPSARPVSTALPQPAPVASVPAHALPAARPPAASTE
jgi:hypothetical protein